MSPRRNNAHLGVWGLIAGSGELGTAKGAGTVQIRAVSPPDREFELPGEIITAG